MKKNRIRLAGSILGGAGVLALLVGVLWGIPALTDANRPTEVPADVADTPVYLISDYRHPTPTPEPVAPPPPPPAEEVYEEPPFEPTLCPPGTVANAVDGNGNESNCQIPCNAWTDLDGDGYAETCTAAPYEGRRFNSA